jgi:hypothetical protein
LHHAALDEQGLRVQGAAALSSSTIFSLSDQQLWRRETQCVATLTRTNAEGELWNRFLFGSTRPLGKSGRMRRAVSDCGVLFG